MLVPVTRLVIAMAASLCGVLATAILWKPGVIAGALLIPVITVFLDQSLGAPLVRAASRKPVVAGAHSRGQNLKVALVAGLIGFLIVGAALTAPRLAEGEPLKATPLFGGPVPVVAPDDDGDGIADADGDGIADADDNCPDVANGDQANTNGAGRGDACDPDDDNDGRLDGEDNCPAEQNPAQEDGDEDGVGDACDEDTPPPPTDSDGDTVPDADDNCPDVANEDQANFDGDEQGDECDDDDDNDSTLDADDPEPLNPLNDGA